MTYNPDEFAEYAAQFNEAYAAAVPPDSGSSGDTVPDGAYQVRISVAEVVWSKKTSAWILRWDLEVLGPECRGKKITHWNRFKGKDEQDTTNKLGWLKKDLAVVGIEIANLARLEPLLPSLEGKVLEVQVSTKNGYQNVYFNRVVQVNPDVPAGDVPF